jgi:hypothetical protein
VRVAGLVDTLDPAVMTALDHVANLAHVAIEEIDRYPSTVSHAPPLIHGPHSPIAVTEERAAAGSSIAALARRPTSIGASGSW